MIIVTDLFIKGVDATFTEATIDDTHGHDKYEELMVDSVATRVVDSDP